MRPLNIVLTGGVFIFCIVISDLLAPKAAAPIDEDKKAGALAIARIYATPIEFHGRVEDEEGNPVEGASVGLRASDRFMASGSRYERTTDAEGNFSIKGIKGVELSVSVSKDGYHRIHGRSNAVFAYASGPDSTRRPKPTPGERPVFVLKKQGEIERLNVHDSGGIRIPKDGQAISIDIKSGTHRSGAEGDVVVQVWTDTEGLNTKSNYRWRYRLGVPGGGVQEKLRKDAFGFKAPEEGYQDDYVFEMPAQPENGRWIKSDRRTFFLKLSDGSFAKLWLFVTSGGEHFFEFESHHNPSGSRNLETRAR